METHLYSKRKCLLFSCTVCQRTFVCLFYYCLSNSFLFIEHSSMSVKCFFFFFFLTRMSKIFLYVKKRSVFHVLGNREIQTNVDKLICIRKHPRHTVKVPEVRQVCTFFCVCFKRAIPTFMFTHG